jgi:hypothetical protein
MKIQPVLKLTLFDETGRKIFQRTFRSKSYLRAFIKQIWSCFRGIGDSFPDTTNTSRTIGWDSFYWVNAPSGDTSYGMVSGTGTTAVSLSDYKLETLIPNGTAAGQLSYGATLVESYTETPSQFHFFVRRSLNNQSTGNVIVSEVGLYGRDITWNFALIRDVISAITVTPGQTLTIEYQIKIVI